MASIVKKHILPIIIFLLFSLIYLHSLSFGAYGGDVGDLVTSAKIFGVAHPPGYPLFTLLGFLLTRINFISPAFMVGLISVFASVISLIIYFYFSLELTKNKFISFVSVLVLGFNYLFWLYSEIAEVFALNTLFVLAILFFAYLYYKKKQDKLLYIVSLLVGLALTHHQTIVLIFPSVLILIATNYKKIILKPMFIVKNIALVLLGFSVYLYVPLASFHNPIINWDNVKDLSSFLRLLLRQDYGTLNAGAFEAPSLAQRLVILKTYLGVLLTQLTIPVVLISILGLISSLFKNKIVFLSLILAFIISGPLFITYAGFPLLGDFFLGVYERFFIESMIILLIFFPIGLASFIAITNKLLKKKIYQNLFIGVFLIIPLSLFYYNFPKTDLHNISIGNDLAYDILSPLPKNTVLFLAGDTVLFNTWYVHYGLGFRPDLKIININGLSGDNFFREKLAQYQKLHPKEKDQQQRVANVIKQISSQYPVYSSQALGSKNKDKLIWVPDGLNFKLLNSTSDIPDKESYLKNSLKMWSEYKYIRNTNSKDLALGNLTISDIPNVYSSALLALGNYFFTQYNDKEIAFEFYNKAKNISLNYYKPYQILGVYYLDKKDCKNAAININKSIDIYPLDKTTYYLSYLTYKTCFKNNEKAKKVAEDYADVYHSDFFKDAKSELQKLKLND